MRSVFTVAAMAVFTMAAIAADAPKNSTLKVGQRVIIDRPGKANAAPLYTDLAAYDEYEAALATKDTDKLSTLAEAHRVVIVPEGSRGTIVGTSERFPEIEILDGIRQGLRGYVDRRDLKASKPGDRPKKTSFKVGQVVIINRPGAAGHAHLCLDMTTYDALQKALAEKDLATFRRLLNEEEKIVIVSNGAPARVINTRDPIPNLELLDGPSKGVKGYVYPLYLRAPTTAKPRPR